MDSLGEMCFAQFAKMYKSYSSRGTTDEDNSGHEDVKGDDEEINDHDDGYQSEEDEDEKFNYVMTHETKDNNKKGEPLPDYIVLSDPYPGEPHLMRRRRFPAVLRFNKINQGNNPHKYMLGELMLYRPVSEEINIEKVESQYDETYKDKRRVDIVKSQVMKHLEGVEEGSKILCRAG